MATPAAWMKEVEAEIARRFPELEKAPALSVGVFLQLGDGHRDWITFILHEEFFDKSPSEFVDEIERRRRLNLAERT